MTCFVLGIVGTMSHSMTGRTWMKHPFRIHSQLVVPTRDLFECNVCQEVKDHCRQREGLVLRYAWESATNSRKCKCGSHDFCWCSLVLSDHFSHFREICVEAPNDLLLNTMKRSMGNGSFGLKILQCNSTLQNQKSR